MMTKEIRVCQNNRFHDPWGRGSFAKVWSFRRGWKRTRGRKCIMLMTCINQYAAHWLLLYLGAIVQPPSAFVDDFFFDDPLRQEISVNSDTQVTFRPTYFCSRDNLFYRNILKMTQQNQIIFIDNLPQSLAVQYSAFSFTSLNFCCQSNIQNTIDKFTRIFLIDDVDCMLVTHGK